MALVPAFYALRDLGSSLLPTPEGTSGRERILSYLLQFPLTVIEGGELMAVSGIDDWARRVRELRVEHGWWIYSGVTFQEICSENLEEKDTITATLGISPDQIGPDDYVLMSTTRDERAAQRWKQQNAIRRKDISVQDKILEYFRLNVGQQITGEELRYLANDRNEWPRRVRELRTEEGWPILTKNLGRDDLPVGVYMLEEDRQSPPHDRDIPDSVRVEVLERDLFSCTSCGWKREQRKPEDPRKSLELHHKIFHRHKGDNTAGNLIALCNVCHDKVHAESKD